MPATWPEGVPHTPLANTFRLEPFRAPHATDMEDGAQRTRPATSMQIATLRFTIRMPNPAFVRFQDFVWRELVSGTLPFVMPVWTGEGFASRRCRFRERYVADPGHGLRHRVQLALDVEDYWQPPEED